MSQQINLFNPELIKKTELLTPRNMGLAYLGLACLGLAWMLYSQQSVSRLTLQRDQLATQLQQLQDGLKQATAARTPHEANAALVQELAQLNQQQQTQSKLLQVINGGVTVANKNLSAYMRGFANQTTEGLWLTGFSIDPEHDAMSVFGRSLNADLLPKYIEMMGKENVFAGQLFGGLKVIGASAMTHQALGDVKSDATGTKTDANKAAAAFVEFELQAMSKADATKEKLNSINSIANTSVDQVRS